MSRVWPPAALLAAAIGVWELVVRAAQVPDYLLPAPSAVASVARRRRRAARAGRRS